MKIPFVKFPVVKFKKASPKTVFDFYERLYTTFKVEEDLGSKWHKECLEAIYKKDNEKLAKLIKAGGRITFDFELLNIIINNFTLNGCDSEKKQIFLDLATRSGFIKSIEFEENPKRILIKTADREIKVLKFTDTFEHEGEHILETQERFGRCHKLSV